MTWPAIEAHQEYITGQLKAGVTVTTVHQRLRDEHGLAVSISSFRRYVDGERAGGDAPVQGEGAAPVPGRAWCGGADRLRAAGPLAGPGGREAGDGLGVRDGAGVLAAPVRAAGDPAGPAGRGASAMWRRSRSSAGSRPGWCRTTSRPGWTARTCMTRGSTVPMPSWPRITGAWSTRPALTSRRTSPGSSGRCRMCGTRSGAAGSSSAWSQMQEAADRWSLEVAGRPGVPAAGRRGPGRGVRRGRERRAAAAASRSVRAGHVGEGEDQPGHPCPGRQGAVLGAVAAYRQDRRCPADRHDGAVLHRRAAGQDPPAQGARQAHRFRRLPSEKIAFHMRTPAWCRKQAAGIGPACEQVTGELLAGNALYRAARRPGRDRPGRPARPIPAGSRMREGDHRRRPVLPDHQGHPGRPGAERDEPAAGLRPGTAAPPLSCAARRHSRTSSPCPA